MLKVTKFSFSISLIFNLSIVSLKDCSINKILSFCSFKLFSPRTISISRFVIFSVKSLLIDLLTFKCSITSFLSFLISFTLVFIVLDKPSLPEYKSLILFSKFVTTSFKFSSVLDSISNCFVSIFVETSSINLENSSLNWLNFLSDLTSASIIFFLYFGNSTSANSLTTSVTSVTLDFISVNVFVLMLFTFIF